ncbi:hypothetical protein KGA66_22450 [Actinocrinis puniceicyclus]|uniref:Uncharacterized protein n=1 Tax=Actinocrinis puniceicyclus TaxID=977794 RepID=A0A8J8BGJ3_9ACTN|nr:hypothetical protein [Actinocrinis puniceicyclus]MBS2965829.1 hypothetical protein [Actinocrinis puniceicyclus]
MHSFSVVVVADGALTGTWIGDDKAVYYVRHEAGALWWVGLSTDTAMGAEDFHLGLRFANVFRGRLVGEAVIGEFVDTPRGDVPQNGTLDLAVVSVGEMRRLRELGGFGASAWHRIEAPARAQAAARLAELVRADGPADQRRLVCAQHVVAEGVIVRGFVSDRDDITFALRTERNVWEPWGAQDVTPEQAAAALDHQGDVLQCTLKGQTGTTRLPGWMQRDASSVLFSNGRPINGYADAAPDGSVRVFGRHIAMGTRVRVAGCLTMRRSSASAEPGEVAIYPVYVLDFVAPVARGTYTGVWCADDGGTYYLRQIGDVLWWLGMSHDQGRSFTSVFSGVLVPDGTGTVVHGELVDVPLGARRDARPISLHSTQPTTFTALGERPRRWWKLSDHLGS